MSDSANALAIPSAARNPRRVTFAEIAELALVGLNQMFELEKGLFCKSLVRTPKGLVRVGTSLQNTLIALIGLFRARSAGLAVSIDIDKVLNRICVNMAELGSAGDLGLLLWACTAAKRHDLKDICDQAKVNTIFFRYRDVREHRTMELAWLLAGLSHVVLSNNKLAEPLRSTAFTTFELIKRNQGCHGLFGHASRRNSISGLFRGHIGSFADQIYPVCAMSVFAKAYEVETAVRSALHCARTLCATQGPMGQWWWHYDVLRGCVVSRYPVYAVHQDAMAPMSLFTLSEVSGVDFGSYVERGLQWVGGQNELGYDLKENTLSVIWRNIHLPKYKRYIEEAWHLFMRGAGDASTSQDLSVLFECHSYHLGWILNAFAGEFHTRWSPKYPAD